VDNAIPATTKRTAVALSLMGFTLCFSKYAEA